MRTSFLLFVTLTFLSGCCCCHHESKCPPLNCMGLAYEGSGSPCFHPAARSGAACRALQHLPRPLVRYYEERYADCIGRHVCNDCDPGEGIIGYPTQNAFAPDCEVGHGSRAPADHFRARRGHE